jgi:Lipocalin-like domain
MSVEIIAEGPVPYQEPDVFGGTPQERSEAISTYISYAGPFELLLDRDTVIHYIEVCSYPNWIGNPQLCLVRLERDLLVLSTKPMIFQGVTRSAELIWERVRRD